MTKFTFNETFSRLFRLWGIMPEDKVDVYYAIFKNKDEVIFSRAINWVIDNYAKRVFPLPADIFEGMKNVKREIVKISQPDQECGYCQGTGFQIKQCEDQKGKDAGYTHAVYCGCRKGQSMKIGHADYINKRKWEVRK